MPMSEARRQTAGEGVVVLVAQIISPKTLEPPAVKNEGLESTAQVHRRLKPLLSSMPVLDLVVEPYKVRVVVGEELAWDAAKLAIRAQRKVWASDPLDVDGPRLAIGLAAGPAFQLLGADGETHWTGDAAERAELLSNHAAAGALVADSKVRQVLLQSSQGSSREAAEIAFGRKLAIRVAGQSVGYACYELLWGGVAYGLRPRKGRPRRRRGTIQRWDANRHHGFVVTDDGDFFYTDRRYLTGQSDPRPEQTVYFVPASPLKTGKNPVASALVGVGDRMSGEVIRTDGHVLIRSTDRVMNGQDIPHDGDDLEVGLERGDTVRFTVGEAARGPVAVAIALPDDLPSIRNEITVTNLDQPASVTDRFIAGVMDTLARKGAGGAASSVQRATRKRPGAISRSSQTEQDRVFALVDHALQVWVRRALQMIDQEVLAARIGTLEPITTAEHAALAVRWLRDFIGRLRDATRSQFGDDYAPVFSEALRAASHAAQISRQEEEPLTEPMLLSIQHAARACALAFRVGVFTAIPPEVRDVATKLDAIGAVKSDDRSSPIALREQIVGLLRVDDKVGLREILRRERTHFERGILERLQLAGDTLGDSADFDRLKPVEADLWALVERRLATLLPLVEYSTDLLSEETQALARFAERSVPTKSTIGAWREGHRWPVWLVVWSLGVAASAGGHWASARALWDTETSEADDHIALATMQQRGGWDLGDHLTLARFGKRMPLDGLWHLAFRLASVDAIVDHYPEMFQGQVEDATLGFLSHAGDWSWILAALSGQADCAAEIPKYWKKSQVKVTFPSRLHGDKLLGLAVAKSLFRAPTETVIECAADWAANSP